MKFKNYLDLYDYHLPQELIAQNPATPRDKSRLIIYSKKDKNTKFDTFIKLDRYLSKNSVLVFNQTKVIPARLIVKKETGGIVKILYLGKKNNLLNFLSDKNLHIGSKLYLNAKIFFTVKRKIGNTYYLLPSFSIQKLQFILNRFGKTPIPPYINKSSLKEKALRKKYQTIFAKNSGSIAAPTASLHFTKRLIKKILKRKIQTKFITLHVNLGTFSPLKEENFLRKTLHKEYYEIDKKTADFLNNAKKNKFPIIAVGTTVVRTLESATVNNKIIKLKGETEIFIKDDYVFKFVDGIITNFHVPKSSLLMLVASFAGRREILNLYKKAIQSKFRFYSFGDGMLIY